MRLKTYFARNVESALSQAREELGPEAMLVHSRKAPPESAHLGEYEVVFATLPGGDEGASGQAASPPPSAAAILSAPTPAPPAHSPLLDRLSSEVSELRKQLERMASAVTRTNLLTSLGSLPGDEVGQIFSSFLLAEMDPELALDILNRVRAQCGPLNGEFRRAVAAELEGRFSVESRLGRSAEGPRVVALVGPCGAGKTTTLVKLAALEGLKSRRPAQILSLDNYRVAASEQLRSYAAILGVGFQVVETPRGLAQALEEHRRKDLILIDTPGYAPADLQDAADLAPFLAGRPEIDTHLVLTASMKSADLSRVVDRFEVFRPRKLLFTKLDETDTFGPIFNEAARTGKPISFLAGGQRIPEDLEPATKDRILDLLWKGQRIRAAAAA